MVHVSDYENKPNEIPYGVFSTTFSLKRMLCYATKSRISDFSGEQITKETVWTRFFFLQKYVTMLKLLILFDSD